MKFNWFNLLSLIPYIVQGIQVLHAEAPGTTKKQLALDALGLATAGAAAVLPAEQAAQANAVSSAVGSVIDSLVAFNHATNAPGFGTNSVKPA
jgi:hypothetical protein